jgi:hypothetical protein
LLVIDVAVSALRRQPPPPPHHLWAAPGGGGGGGGGAPPRLLRDIILGTAINSLSTVRLLHIAIASMTCHYDDQ